MGKRPLGRPTTDGRIILNWIFQDVGCGDNIKMDLSICGLGRPGLDYCVSGEVQVAGACEYGNELSGSVKCSKFID